MVRVERSVARVRALAIAWLAAACSSPARPSEEQARPTVQTPAPTPSVMAPAAAPTPTTADAAATAAPEQPLVSYGGVSVFGADELVILPDGRVRSSFAAPGKPDDVKSGAVTPDELAAMERSLGAADCCALRSQRTIGVPDEGHTELRLGFPGLACAVSLWDNEWHELPAAAACARIIDRLRRRVR
jgi:hypothetical protein